MEFLFDRVLSSIAYERLVSLQHFDFCDKKMLDKNTDHANPVMICLLPVDIPWGDSSCACFPGRIKT